MRVGIVDTLWIPQSGGLKKKRAKVSSIERGPLSPTVEYKYFLSVRDPSKGGSHRRQRVDRQWQMRVVHPVFLIRVEETRREQVIVTLIKRRKKTSHKTIKKKGRKRKTSNRETHLKYFFSNKAKFIQFITKIRVPRCRVKNTLVNDCELFPL